MNLTGRAELVRAFASGGPEMLKAAAQLVGFKQAQDDDDSLHVHVGEQTAITQAQVLSLVEESNETEPEEVLFIPFWRVISCEYNQEVLSGKITDEVAVSSVSWKPAQAKSPKFIPLAKWPHLLPYLRKEAMAKVPGVQLDMGRIVRCLSRGEFLQTLPHKPRLVWGAQVQVILDRSDRLIPYWDDQEWLSVQLAQVLPAESSEIAFMWEGVKDPLFTNHQAYQLPAPGGLVLVLSDLGKLTADTATQRIWRKFGERVIANGCRAVALFPGGQCPASPPWKILAWERLVASSSPLANADALFTLLAPAIRIEPGLLRSIRRWQNLDAGSESLFWQHPDLSGTSSVAATINPKRAEDYRKAFDNLPEQDQLEVLKRIREWRYHVPDEVWFEECALNPDIYRFLTEKLPPDDSREEVQTLRQDLKYAEQFFQYHGQNAPTFSAGARYWFRRMEKRTDTSACPEPFQKALNRMWHAVHHDEPNVKHPVGYNPADISIDAPLRTWQVFHQDARLLLLAAPHPAAATAERGASWLGQLQTRNGQFSLDDEPPFWQGEAPPWASDWGKDDYGLWVEFILKPPLPNPPPPGGREQKAPSPLMGEGRGEGEITQRLRWIPPGSFLMGSPASEPERDNDEGPQHQVTLTKGFWLFDTAVTQALWQAVMGKNPSNFRDSGKPVENVNWNDAKAFIGQLNDRLPGLELTLPTEAQWEYACRAGTQTPFYFGDNITPEQVNYNGKYPYNNAPEGLYREETVVVKSLPPNAWGLYEMHGNVWEWCQDYWSDHYPAEAQTDPTGPTSGSSRVIRGGSWGFDARLVRAAARIHFAPADRLVIQGFRCARVQSGAKPVQAEPVPSAKAAPEREPQRMEQGVAGAWVQTGEASSYRLPWPNTESFILRTDAGALHVSSMPKPAWATNTGRDRYGLWAEFSFSPSPLTGEGRGEGEITQRLRWIPPGRFLMGSPESEPERYDDEGPQHEVTLTEGFWLFDTAVTQALWEAVMGENPSDFQGPTRPVENVSWNKAQEFIKKLNDALPGLELCLPFEAQWEHACRAGTQTPFYFGDNIIPEQVNYDGRAPYNNAPKGLYRKETVAVKSLPPNAWGLYEMHGNVWEWCADYWGNYSAEAQTDPTGPTDGSSRVLRGGSWDLNARHVRAACRSRIGPDFRLDSLGFRCARVQA